MELNVVFRNNIGLKLIGKLSYPSLKQVSYPTIILCHGFASNMDLFFLPDLTTALMNSGFAVLRFDCRACGKSEGRYHPTYKTMVDDLESAISFVKSHKDLELFSLVGHSMGGTAVLMSASNHPELKAVVACAPVASVAELSESKRKFFKKVRDGYELSVLGRTHHLTEEWFSDSLKVDPVSKLKKCTVPVLVLHGDSDKRVELSDAEALKATNPLVQLKILPGVGHHFDKAHEIVNDEVLSFFKRHNR